MIAHRRSILCALLVALMLAQISLGFVRSAAAQTSGGLAPPLRGIVHSAAAQTSGGGLEERLDEEEYLRGLVELELADALEYYIRAHPPANPVEDFTYRIAAAQIRVRQVETSDARAEAIASVVELRNELIDSQRTHSRRAIWLADQAGDLFFDLLPIDASGVTALFGVPTAEQRERAQYVAREMHRVAGLAETDIERALLRMEAEPGYRTSENLQMKRRNLARDERDRRIPFYRGIGAYLHGELNLSRPSERREMFQIAARALEPLFNDGDPRIATQAKLYSALAQAQLGNFDAAETLFADIARNSATPPIDIFAARMGGVINRAVARGPESAIAGLDSILARYQGRNDFFYRVLIADQRYRLGRMLAEERTGDARRSAIADAFRAWLRLLDDQTGLSADAVRAVVFEKLAIAADGDAPLDDLPPIVTVARADRLARDPSGRGAAIELYESALARNDLDPRGAAAALFGLGRVLYDSNKPLEAVRRFTQLARDHPRDAAAERAIESAVAIGVPLRDRQSDDREVDLVVDDALGLLLARYPNVRSIDRWRYAAGRIALADGDHSRAIEHFDSVTPRAAERIDAQFMKLNVLHALLQQDVPPDSKRARARDLLEAAPQVERVIREAAATNNSRADDFRYYLAHASIFRARAQLALDEPHAALAALDELEAISPRGGTNRNVQAAALRTRIDVLHALGRAQDAQSAIAQFQQTSPDEAGPVIEAMLASMIYDVESLRDEGREDEARREAERDLAPLATMLAAWMTAQPIDDAGRATMHRRIADAYRLAGRFDDALRHYEELARTDPDAIEVLLGTAECQFNLGEARLEEAMRIYKRIAAAGRETAGRNGWWIAQLRMLQILDRVDRNTHQILPQIQRLRLEFPELGGPRTARGFQQLEARYAGRR